MSPRASWSGRWARWALAPTIVLASCGGGEAEPDPGGGDGDGPADSPFRFQDATAESGVAMTITSGRTPSTQILEVKGGGLALLDLENDGDLDLFVPNGATLDAPAEGPGARLFENQGGMRFQDATERAGLGFRRWGMGVTAGDVDGDGFDDLFVACFGPNALLANRGGERLEERTAEAGLTGPEWNTGCTFGDLDLDGDLDLYVVGYIQFDLANPPARTRFGDVEVFAGPRGLAAQADRAWENAGDGTFREITAEAGFDLVEPAWGLGVVILDFDGDATPEVFVGNDSMPNFLFRRGEDGDYADVAPLSGLASNADGQNQATMGIAIGDVDGGGFPDVFTTNFASDTNTLHVNRGELRFLDRSQAYGLGIVSRVYLGWASMFYDLDHDGDEDLLVFNGHVYPQEATDQLAAERAQPPLLFERDGRRFRRVTDPAAGAWLSEPHVDRSAAFGDLDADGDVDVVVGELNGPVRVLRNDGAPGSWLIVELRDPAGGNPHALGARVEARSGGLVQTRWIHVGGSYLAASAPYAHFGFPAGSWSADLLVTWPDGVRQEVSGQLLDRHLIVER